MTTKRVVLTLEYDLGDYADMFDDYAAEGREVSLNPERWQESFFQSDINTDKLNIISVRVETQESK